jgi:hypothetical protein
MVTETRWVRRLLPLLNMPGMAGADIDLAAAVVAR